MTYYIQISLWLIQSFGWHVTPLQLKQTYNDGKAIYVVSIAYRDSLGLDKWVDSSRTYPVITINDSNRINIVQLRSTDFK